MKPAPVIHVLAFAGASLARGTIRRQSGIVDPGVDPNCDYYDTAYSGSDTCHYFETFWGVSHENFLKWNPSVGSDCSGIKDGHSYCVDVKASQSTAATMSKATTPTGSPAPSPTQDGVVASCDAWYWVKPGDNCDTIVKKFGNFTKADFLAWNPGAGSDCTGLLAKVYCCVGVPGYSMPIDSTTAHTTTTAGNGIATPSRTEPGMVDNCDAFYLVVKGDTCHIIVSKFANFTLDDFVTWNSGIGGRSCDGLWAGVYACIGVVGKSGVAPSPSTKSPTAPSSSPTPTGCQVPHPDPTQGGSICNCKQWYLPAFGEYCYDIEKKFHISADQFNAWNPDVGSNCQSLWKDSYVCVSA